MRSSRLPLFSVGLSIALFTLATARGRGQSERVAPLDIVFGLGLPAVDRGVVIGEARMPGLAEAARRVAHTGAGFTDVLAASGRRVMRGRILVKFREGTSSTSREAALSAVSPVLSIDERPSDANFDRVRIGTGDDPESVARSVSEQPGVEYAQAVHRVYPQFVPNDPLYKELQWNFPLIDLERAWDIQPTAGSSITVAVIDTGIAYTTATITTTLPSFTFSGVRYPALGRVTIPYAAASQLGPSSRFVAPRDFVCEGTSGFSPFSPLDFDGHGTHVAGTIGQLTNDNTGVAGVAFNVKIMPIKVLASTWDVVFGCATEEGGSDEDVARGLRYAVDNGAKVINLSLGGPDSSSPVMEDAMRYAVGKGAFLSIAVGNEFEEGNPVEEPAEIASRLAGAVSVAAVDPLKQHAYYSNTGTWVELAAPGGSNRGFDRNGFVWQQTFDFSFTDTFLQPPARFTAPRFDVFGYIGYIGTSMAAPHVAGVAAMLMQQGITDPAAVEAALERYATDLGEPGRDRVFGFGLVQARNPLLGLGIAK